MLWNIKGRLGVWLRIVLLLLAAMLGCGRKMEPPSTPYSTPAIDFYTGDGLCSNQVVLDVAGRVFTSHGCESSGTPLVLKAQKGPAVFTSVDGLLSAVLSDPAASMCQREADREPPYYFIYRYATKTSDPVSIILCPKSTPLSSSQQAFLDAMTAL